MVDFKLPKPGYYEVRISKNLRPKIDDKLGNLVDRLAMSVADIKKTISNNLRSYINDGDLPPDYSIHSKEHPDYGKIIISTPMGIQVAYCIFEQSSEIIIVGINTGT